MFVLSNKVPAFVDDDCGPFQTGLCCLPVVRCGLDHCFEEEHLCLNLYIESIFFVGGCEQFGQLLVGLVDVACL